PGDVELLVSLAKAQKANGLEQDAKSTLGQAKLLAPDSADELAGAAQELFGDEDLAVEGNLRLNALGLKSVVVVDSDETVTRELGHIFSDIGVDDVHVFHDGEAALKHFENGEEPDLIIHEWRIPKISGPYFIQKIRHKG